MKEVYLDNSATTMAYRSVGELVLWLYGRDEVRVTIDGDESGIKRNSL